MFTYCKNNPVNMIDKDGHFAHILIGAIVGTICGVAGQFISDMVTSAINRKFQLSNIQTYTGAAIGGFVGGAVTMAMGPFIGLTVGSMVSTAVGQTLENKSGVRKRTTKEIAINTAIDGGFGALTSMLPIPKLKGITSGIGSYSSVFKAGLTKIKNEIAVNMSTKVISKGVISETVGGIYGSVASGAKNATWDILGWD